MKNYGILTKDNIDELFKKLSILFNYGSYGTDNEYFEPHIAMRPFDAEYPAGLTLNYSEAEPTE